MLYLSTNKILVVGDLHISDRFSGRHINYLENCFDCLDMIEKSIIENEITHLICLGDWIGIGLAEKNLKERRTLLRLIQVLQKWNKLLNGNVYSLRGNHDIGKNMTDYDFFVTMGLLKYVPQLDIGTCRIHMFNYGEETRTIYVDNDKYNIGCFHSNLLIEGLTTWYKGGVGVELSSLKNLYGISMAIAGHIHNPSLRLVSTSINDSKISLFYPGCPTRPRLEPNMWDKSYGVVITTDDLDTQIDLISYDLKPLDEVFTTLEEDPTKNIDDEESTPFDLETLNEILNELQYFNVNSGQDYVSQIKRVAGLDKTAADIALKYLEDAEAQFAR